MRSYECYIKPAAGEHARVDVALPDSGQALISGRVTDGTDPVSGALVLLLSEESDDMILHTVTDGLGRFWLGPVESDALYRLRVQRADGRVRIVELEG